MRELARRFLPVADEVYRLQTGDGPDCRYFQEMAEHGHYAGRALPSSTRQGIYAFAPSGAFLASINTRSADRVLEMMRGALEAWDALDDGERWLAVERPVHPERAEVLYPDGGLVLRVTSRDLEREEGSGDDWRVHAWNFDYAWFTAVEMRAFLPEPLEVGRTATLSDALVRRLARLHLIDNVRGQVWAFPSAAVREARLAVRVASVEGSRVELVLEGATHTSQEGEWSVHGFRDAKEPSEQRRGFEAELLGRATWDTEAERFVAFRLVALGERWGGTQFSGRHDDLGRAPMGVLLELAGPDERVAPALFRHYRWK